MGQEITLYTGIVTPSSEVEVVDEELQEMDPEELSQMSAEERALAAQTEIFRVEAYTILQGILVMDGELQAAYPEISKELIRLQGELREIKESLAARQEEEVNNAPNAGDDDDPLKDAEENADKPEQETSDTYISEEELHNHFNPLEKAKKEVRNLPEKVKKLFRKIANLTHPDKTRNKRLHALFLEAKAAKNNKDLEALERILREVLTKKSDLLAAMLLRLEKLRYEHRAANNELHRIYAMAQYRMYKDWHNPDFHDHVKAHYSAQVKQNIEETVRQIRHFAPDRYAPAMPTFFKGTGF